MSLTSRDALFLCDSGDEIRSLSDRCNIKPGCADLSDEKDCDKCKCKTLVLRKKRDYMVRTSCSAVVVIDSILLVVNCHLHVGVIKSCHNLNCSEVDLIAVLNISNIWV